MGVRWGRFPGRIQAASAAGKLAGHEKAFWRQSLGAWICGGSAQLHGLKGRGVSERKMTARKAGGLSRQAPRRLAAAEAGPWPWRSKQTRPTCLKAYAANQRLNLSL